MGSSQNFCCRTCHKNYELGYGQSSSWIQAKTLEEYELSPKNKTLKKNQNLRTCLVEHEGHDYFLWTDISWGVDEGKYLWQMTSPWDWEVVIDDFDSYENIDMMEGI